MHNIYVTEGIVLKSFGSGEADKFFIILTRDFGLIKAEAKGVRKSDSKLRYSLSDFSLAEFSFVKGREKWRVANAVSAQNFFYDLRGIASIQQILARVSMIIGRLVHGEEKNEILYEHVKNAFLFLAEVRPEGEFLESVEHLLMLRILHSLGYLGSSPNWGIFTSNCFFEEDLLMKMKISRREAIFAINKSLQESHL